VDISVVIPAFNEEKYLGTCLRSLQCQDFDGNYEVIVADNSSDDRTVRIGERYADRVVVHPRDTIARGRQTGADATRYPVIAFTDADTCAAPDWLSQLAGSLEDDMVAGVHGQLMPYDGNLLEQGFCRYVLPPYSSFMAHINRPSAPGSNFAVKREAFEKAGGFNTKLVTGEDVELCRRVGKYGHIAFNPDALVRVSTRRVRKWGYARILSFHVYNTVKIYTSGQASMEFEPVR
jgi:cellulose synthase/poly-beta-1,6-N-acetylglucosamine synthase-like glycosyltransferase